MPIPIEEKDLTLKTPHGYFNLRVGYLFFKDEKVLLHKSSTDGWWFVPGGRVQFGESTKDALLREIDEEMQAVPLHHEDAGLVENFFEMGGFTFHELAVYYRADFAADIVVPPCDKAGKEILSGWFSKDGITEIDLKPSFLKTRLFDFKQGVAHVICSDKT